MNYKSENGLTPSRSSQKVKKPKKYNTIKNKRHGNLKGATNNIIYDPNDVARTTIKEQNIDNNFRSNVSVATRGNTVYDHNDIAETTIKEQNIEITLDLMLVYLQEEILYMILMILLKQQLKNKILIITSDQMQVLQQEVILYMILII